MAGVGPMFGQFGHFYRFAKEKLPYPIERYTNETRRLLGVLETRFNEGPYLAGDEYSIADIATFPWVGCLDWGYKAADDLKLQQDFPKVMAWYARCTERPASVRGAKVCPF
jgi:GST-like protein